MGRKKITIQQITDPKLRNITYNKRKNGLIKKAAEISLLCNINLMLVFEDLNGTLVQFSRNKIKDISTFNKDCHYKRVLELTAEDYPDFSKIRRHKKKQCIPEQTSSQTQSVSGNVRTFTDLCSDQDSIVAKEEIFTDFDQSSYFPSMELFNAVPDMSIYGEGYQNGPLTSWFQQDQLTKRVKTTSLTQPAAQKSPKENKNKLNLRLKIVNPEENQLKEAMKMDSCGSKKKTNSSQKKPNSSQKNSYSRRSNFEPIVKSSPYNEAVKSRDQRTLYNFMEGLECDFAQFSPFSSQVIRPSPSNMQKEGGDMYSNEQIINYFNNSGRASNGHQNVYTFQQNDPQQILETSYEHGYGMEAEIGSTKKYNYRDQLSGRESYGRMETAAPSDVSSRHGFSFSGFILNNDQRFLDRGETKMI